MLSVLNQTRSIFIVTQLTVGSPSRAKTIAAHLDESPKPFQLSSERGFNTVTGRYQGVPVSIISIGMGSPNMDFFVREVRECLAGDMLIIRSDSCCISTEDSSYSCLIKARILRGTYRHASRNGCRAESMRCRITKCGL